MCSKLREMNWFIAHGSTRERSRVYPCVFPHVFDDMSGSLWIFFACVSRTSLLKKSVLLIIPHTASTRHRGKPNGEVAWGLRHVCGVARPAPLALLQRACTTSLSRTFCECLLQHSRSPSPLFASYQAFSITAVPAATCCDGQKLPGAP